MVRRIFPIIVIALLACLCLRFACGQSDLVERLGFKSNDKLLIINADDFGVSPAVNAGTLKALEFGLVKSATIIVPAPAFAEAASMVKANPGLDVGIHLALSCGYGKGEFGPVLPPKEVPSLVTPKGYFRPSEELGSIAKDEAIKEFRAQIERAIAAGIRPTHVDCHMGCYEYRFDFFLAAVKLAREYGLPMRNGLSLRKALVSLSGVLSNDLFAMFYDVQESEREKTYTHYFMQLKPGVNELAVHVAEPIAGRVDDPDEPVLRAHELRIFTSPKTRELLDQLGIKLIGYRELQRLQNPPTRSAK
jgi:hypothetical protein